MARKRMKAQERRQQIMDVAQRLFAREGYSQTTTAAIAEAAGVTEPILYRHFKSKRDLFLKLLEQLSHEVIAKMRELLSRSDDPREQLQTLITSYPAVAEHMHESSMMTNRALASVGKGRRGSGQDVRPLLAAHYDAYEKLIVEVVENGQANGQFRDDVDPRVAAWHFIHAALAFTMTRNLQPPVFKKKLFVPQSAELLMQGLMK